MASSKIFIGNAGFRSEMLTYFVEGMARSGPHLLPDFQQKSLYTIAVATRCWTEMLIWGYGLLEDFYRKYRFEIRNADRLCRRNGNVRPSCAAGFLKEILICNCICNNILKKILVSALPKDFYRKCKFELQNAQRFCPRNEKVGPSFAPKIVTNMLIWDCICNKLLKDNLNIGVWFPREYLSEMQAWAPKCSKICQGNGKVGLSFATGCLTKMLIWVGICRAFGTKTLMLLLDLWLGSERSSTFEDQCAECFGHGNGKVSLSTSHIHRIQSKVLTQ